jgi:hypothetical protein
MWQQVKQALADSTAHFLSRLASLLPGLVALVLALLVSIILAWILAMIVKRVLTSLHFDERLGQWGFASLAEWSPRNSPTILISRSLAGLVIVGGFLIGVAAFDFEWSYLFVASIFVYVPNVLAAFVVLLVGNIIARFLARSVLIGAVNLNLQYARFLSIGVKWLVIVLAVAMVVCNIRVNVLGWPLAIASSLLYFLLFWKSRLYGDASLQIFFALVAGWGWWQWLRGTDASGAALKVRRLGPRGRWIARWSVRSNSCKSPSCPHSWRRRCGWCCGSGSAASA